MSKSTRPHTSESAICDCCGVSRQWGAYNSKSGLLVCQVCLAAYAATKGTDAGSFKLPSDAVSRPTEAVLAVLRAH